MSIWDFEGDLDYLINHLQNIKTEHSEFDEFEIICDGEKYELFGYRPETIIEKKDRLARQVKAKAAAKKKADEAKAKKKASELKQLKKLIEKYEDELGDLK